MTQANLETYDPELTTEEGFCSDCSQRISCKICQSLMYPEYFSFGCYKRRDELCGTCIYFDEYESDLAVKTRRRGRCTYARCAETYGTHACEEYSPRQNT